MTYRMKSLGEVGTYKKFGGASARFTVQNLQNSSQTAAAPVKIAAAMRAIPGVLSADAAWSAGGVVLANMRMDEGAPVDGTAAIIRREAAKIGPAIGNGVVVSVPSGGTKFTTADVVRTNNIVVPDPTSDAAALQPAAALPTLAPAPAESTGLGVPAMVGIGVGVLALAGGAFFLLRKKPTT